jgi:arginine repressor
MAKQEKVNKTHAVKEYLKANKKAKNQEVVDALAKKGITITANYVANIKAVHNKRRQKARKVVAKGGVGIPEVKAALAFLKLTGTVAAASKALAVAQEIREIV